MADAYLNEEERLACLDAALKDCIQQINSLQKNQELELETELKVENNRLVRLLSCKQELIEQLERDKVHLDDELGALIDRVDSVEKENAFLKCECCALERELVVRMESSDKVERLEDECRQLHLLLQKNLQGHVKDDMNSSGRLNPVNGALVAKDSSANYSRKIDILVDRLCDVEEDNKALREIIAAKQIVPVDTEEISTRKHGHWPWNVLDVILDEHLASNRSVNELLEEIKRLLSSDQAVNPREEIQKKQSEGNLNESICRMVELIEEISPCSLVATSTRCSDSNRDYSVHVFRWRNCELVPILRKFVLSCSLVLNGSYSLEDFVMQLTVMLEWAVGKCITLDDASGVRGKVRKHFSLDRSKSESELDMTSAESENVMGKLIKIQCDLQEENTWLNHTLRSMKSANEEFETKLSSVMEDNDRLRTQLEEAIESIGRFQEEMEDLKDSNGIGEDQFENLKLINEELDTQLTVTKVEKNSMMQKLSSLEIELEDKNQLCEELETTCLELQLQLETVSRKETPDAEEGGVGVRSNNSIEAVAKPEQTLTLGDHTVMIKENGKEESKQVINKEKPNHHHCSLLDRMLADNADTENDAVAVRDMENDTTPGRVITIVSASKKPGGFGFIKGLFKKRRKCSNKKGSCNSTLILQKNTSKLIR